MGVIITMPVRETAAPAVLNTNPTRQPAQVISITSRSTAAAKPDALASSSPAEASATAACPDFSVWLDAPKERTAAYYPTYSAVSRAMQTAMRGWVREWFFANPDVLLRPHTAYPILVFQCTHPFAGRSSSTFTYDIQDTKAVTAAFRSAASRLGRELKELNTQQLPWLKREHYFAYRSAEVVKYVMKNRRSIYGMLNVETMLINAILKFALVDIPALGLEEAVAQLRRTFAKQLHRFSSEFDLSIYTEQLLKVATDALNAKSAEGPSIPAPQQTAHVVSLPFAA